MTKISGKIRREVVACLMSIHEADDLDSLSMFGPVNEEDELLETVKEISSGDKEEAIIDRLKSLVAQEDFTGLADIHPAWLVEVLSKESPRIIGIILRYLPSKQVRYIIEHLPKRIKHKLPQLIDSFAVPAPVLKIIKNRFESQFISLKRTQYFDSTSLKSVAALKTEDLTTLFRDLGIQELAMALKGVDRRSLNILFNRLSIDEARTLQQRIRSLTNIPASLLKDAKYTVLEMSLTEMDPTDLLMEVGLNAFAKSISPEEVEVFPVIKQKLEPRLGYTLKRYLDQCVGSNHPEVCEKRQKAVFSRIEALSKAGSIDGDIALFFNACENTKAIELPSQTTHRIEKSESWHQEDGVVL